MAGAMVAGLALGRSSTLLLTAGFVAAVGLKRMTRRKAVARISPEERRSGSSEPTPASLPGPAADCCCSGEEKTPDLALCEAVSAAADPPLAESARQAETSVPDEEAPLVWEQGRDETVSRGAVEAQTVWFGMQEPAEASPAGLSPEQFQIGAIPALSPRAKADEPPPVVSAEAPGGDLVSLPAVPAIGAGSGTGRASVSSSLAPTSGAGGEPPAVAQPAPVGGAFIPGLGSWNPPKPEAIPAVPNLGAHRSVVPHAPVAEQRKGRRMMLVMTLVLVIAALAAVRGALLQSGWKFPWEMARGGVKEAQLKKAGAWSAPLPERGDGILRLDADGTTR